MARTERIREILQGRLDSAYLEQQAAAGWRPVAIEWERKTEGPGAEARPLADVPFGMRVAEDCKHLEEYTPEKEILVRMLELIVQDISVSRIANELNLGGYRTREGSKWGPIEVFELLPRLIEVGAQVFPSEEWAERRRLLLRDVVF